MLRMLSMPSIDHAAIQHGAFAAFLKLVRSSCLIPSMWKRSIVVPVFKRGSRHNPDHYRPISLACCLFKVLERLIFNRIEPTINSQLDESQAGFRWGPDLQVYALVETLRMRRGHRTLCAFIDIRKAFDTSWVNGALCRLHRAGIQGGMWRLVADMVTNTSSRVRAYGGFSAEWSDGGLAQGRVLSPLLFNILINSLAADVRRACQGVHLDPHSPSSPQLTVLLYADDLVIFAEDAAQLQVALDAVSSWGRRWRFAFGIGETKSAVLVAGSPVASIPTLFLAGSPLPLVSSYRYLGVMVSSNGRWAAHASHLLARGEARFAQCVAWASREGLSLPWSERLFRVYALSAALFGIEFVVEESSAMSLLDRRLRQWGRRLLRWPAGTPNAAVLGELGWVDMEALALDRVAGLFARLLCFDSTSAHTPVPVSIFRYTFLVPGSWAYWAHATLTNSGVPSAPSWGLGRGAPQRVQHRWRQFAVWPLLCARSNHRFREAACAIPSLAQYLVYQNIPSLHVSIHAGHLPVALTREWSLARCGHHPCTDGRQWRHSCDERSCSLCGGSDGSLHHVLSCCPGTADLRNTWMRWACSPDFEPEALPELLRSTEWLFNPLHAWNTSQAMAAHVRFIGASCLRVRAASA